VVVRSSTVDRVGRGRGAGSSTPSVSGGDQQAARQAGEDRGRAELKAFDLAGFLDFGSSAFGED